MIGRSKYAFKHAHNATHTNTHTPTHTNRLKKLEAEKKKKGKKGLSSAPVDASKFSTCKLCAVQVRRSKMNHKEKEHHEAKHPKETLFRCFPALDPSVAATKAIPVAAPKYKPDKPLAVKKKKKKRK